MAEATPSTTEGKAATPSDNLQTYKGKCHCGAVEFTVDLPPLETTPLGACQCSICSKKGYLFVLPARTAVNVTKGAGEDGLGRGVLTDYQFNSKQVYHRFCGTCGTPFGIISKDESVKRFAFNARMLCDVDVLSLSRKISPGPVTPLHYTPPEFEGLAELQAQIEEGEKIYQGACHCGAVTYALRSKPLEHPDVEVKECDCTICTRHAAIFTYPATRSRVPFKLSSPDVLTAYYPLPQKFCAYEFCSICGVSMFQDVKGPQKLEGLPQKVQDMILQKRQIRPVNIRTMHFFLGKSEEDKAQWESIDKRVERDWGKNN